jgi:hypothetical protein
MRELVFLLEEPSARAMLENLLPRLLDDGIRFRLVPFEGKQDLERQLVRRVRGYQNPHARFIVLRDQDSHPACRDLKQRIVRLCQQSGKGGHCLVRLACQELETFYLADLQAVEVALGIGKVAAQQGHRKFRDPDRLGSPSRELRTLTRERYQKVSGSREIGKHLSLNNTRSASFRHLITGIQRLQAELLALPA